MQWLLVFILGLGTGTLSGLLGIGGGIILAPLLLYIPSLLGLPGFDMRAVAGLTMAQALVAALTGLLSHRRYGFVNRDLILWMGGAIFFAAIAGGAFSKGLENQVLMGLFAALAFLAGVLILLPGTREEEGKPSSNRFNRPAAVGIALGVGFLGGLVGQGGSFLLIPLMRSALLIPMRVAIGTNLGIVLCSSTAGFLGKLGTGQVPLGAALVLGAGIIPATMLGTSLSHRTSVRGLRGALAILILAAAVKIGWDALAGGGAGP
ncbi:MAG: sulfite exporter TauE/SafE family protein [Nitrospinota bacterium]